MLGQIGPNFGVFSSGVSSVLLPAVLVGAAVYLVVSLAQVRASSRDEPGPAGAENPVLRTLYALALAVLVVSFVGFGIEALYPVPGSPQDTAEAVSPSPPADKTSAAEPPPNLPEETAEFQSRIGAYEREVADHNRVASVVAIVAAILILIVGLISGLSRLPVIGDGVTLGGVLTLLYGVILAARAPSELFGFFVVALGLIALIATLYLKLRPGRRIVKLDRTAGS